MPHFLPQITQKVSFLRSFFLVTWVRRFGERVWAMTAMTVLPTGESSTLVGGRGLHFQALPPRSVCMDIQY